MPRLLSERATPNLMRLRDPVSGAVLGLFYRLPATSERVAYLGALLRREGDSAACDVLAVRRRAGLALLTGVAEGDFALPGEGGVMRPLSSEAASPHFEPRWRELIEERAPELVEALACHVFEGHYAAPAAAVAADASKKK